MRLSTKLSHRIIDALEANLKSLGFLFSVDGLHSFPTLTFTIVPSNEMIDLDSLVTLTHVILHHPCTLDTFFVASHFTIFHWYYFSKGIK